MPPINTYPEMNEEIKNLLALSTEPMYMYILARILELEAQAEPTSLTLDQLRTMDGEPVWVEDLLIPECSCYHFVQKIGAHVLLIEPRYYPAKDDMVIHYCADDENESYGKTWLAHARRPKKENQHES